MKKSRARILPLLTQTFQDTPLNPEELPFSRSARDRIGSDRIGSGSDRIGSDRDRIGSDRDRIGSDRIGSGSDRIGPDPIPQDSVRIGSDRIGIGSDRTKSYVNIHTFIYIYICASVHISSDIIFAHPSHDPNLLKLKPLSLDRHLPNEQNRDFLFIPFPGILS